VGPLVLIVDDDERNVRLVRDVLEAAGLATLSAATAAEGIALARERTPDLVLLDLRLPDLDGAEAMRLLAADERTAHVPVVASSALAEAEVEKWVGEAGFAGFIGKPVDVVALPAQVLRYAGR
jgi:two-component system cell cycle response regulator DivK